MCPDVGAYACSAMCTECVFPSPKYVCQFADGSYPKDDSVALDTLARDGDGILRFNAFMSSKSRGKLLTKDLERVLKYLDEPGDDDTDVDDEESCLMPETQNGDDD